MRDLAKRRGQHNNYKHFRNHVTTMLKEKKSKYYKERVESCKEDQRKLVSLFKELGNKQTSDKSVNKIGHDNREVTDFKIIAELFNNHFSLIVEKYVTDSDFKQYQFIPTKYVDGKVPNKTLFKILQGSRKFVMKYLNTMPVKRGTGLDDNCCNSITYISIQSSVFPRMWKHAKVFPLHKKKSQDDVNNFYSSKCFLNIRNASFHLYGYLSSHNLLNKRQSRFRANHSCESALT